MEEKMIIGCTKKLQDEMGIIAKKGCEENDLFSWSANMVKVSRRKAVVVVNNSSRFGFILFGLKSKDFKRIDELMLQGIRRCLQDEKIKEEIIERYLSDAGTICFSKTKGPRYVSRLNRACECVGYFQDLLDLENIYQLKATREINIDLVKVSEFQDKYAFELLLTDFKQIYGDSIVKCEAANLLVKLDLEDNTVERKIIIPLDVDFRKLHEVLQIAFNWNDYHLYEFKVINEKGEQVLKIISEYEEYVDLQDECKVVRESEVLIKDYIKDDLKIQYCYDFGDNWQHEIILESIIPDYDKNHPICLEGIGDAPPEDVGGISGYEEFLEIMADPSHSEHETLKGWAASQRYKKFDICTVNRRLLFNFRR